MSLPSPGEPGPFHRVNELFPGPRPILPHPISLARILSDAHPELEGGSGDGLLGFLSFCSINLGNEHQPAKLRCATVGIGAGKAM